MVIFLRVAKEYIYELEKDIDYTADGYYGDLKLFSQSVEINALGTSNYTNILRNTVDKKIFERCGIKYLNGSVDYFYNPYKNSVEEIHTGDTHLSDGQIVVPFIFTQSGLKPLTSIKMSKEYVSLYELYAQLDAIICIGFGFNSDDAHINGIFRQLVDEEKKHLFYVTNNHNTRIIKQKLQKNIRLSSESMKDRIHIISVDSDRKCESLLWTLYVEEQINNIKSQQG